VDKQRESSGNHQTNAPTLQSTFNSYQHANANGAHFIIDKDGSIYQTASLFRITYHVGLMRSRCLITHRCEPAELKKAALLENAWRTKEISDREKAKTWPERFPANTDSIGIRTNEIFRPPDIARKNETEASSAKW